MTESADMPGLRHAFRWPRYNGTVPVREDLPGTSSTCRLPRIFMLGAEV